MPIRSHEDLVVWQRAMQLATEVNDITRRLPSHEQFGLSSQLRRAATSIASNIAEGSMRPTRAYINHLSMAIGSEAEVKTQLTLAVTSRYLTEDEVTPLIAKASEIGRMLRGLIKSLRRHLDP